MRPSFQALNLLLDVLDEQVQVHPVLHRFDLSDPLESESHTVPAQGDVPSLDDTDHAESSGVFPEPRHPVQVRAIKRELDSHIRILTLPGHPAQSCRDQRPVGAVPEHWLC